MRKSLAVVFLIGLSFLTSGPAHGTSANTVPVTCDVLVAELTPQSWVCLAGTLTYENAANGTSGQVNYPEQEVNTPMPKTRVVDDYDTWCEPGGVCQRQRTIYSEETKANAAYGDSTGVKGSFDIVVRTSLNGRSQRWFYTVISDTGPAITITPVISCIEEWLVYVDCGDYTLQQVRVGTRHDWSVVNGGPLYIDDKYHSDYGGGLLTSAGYLVQMSATHSRYWVCAPNGIQCEYPSRNP